MEPNIDRYGALIVDKRGINYGLLFIDLKATNRIDADIELERDFDIIDAIVVSPWNAQELISILNEFMDRGIEE